MLAYHLGSQRATTLRILMPVLRCGTLRPRIPSDASIEDGSGGSGAQRPWRKHDCWSGAGNLLTLIRRSAKCGVSDGGEGWSPP